MKLIKCPKCGEMYSDSYRTCPFCQEDEALKGRAAAPRRKVTRRRRAPSILGPAMVLVVVLAAVLVGVLLFGGKGNAGANGGPNGDLHVYVSVRPHAIFTRRGNDVWCEMPITFTQAALGADVTVPTLDGKVQYHVHEGTQPGDVFKLKGRGIQSLNGRGRGDQYVQVTVEVPKNLSKRQRELLAEFEQNADDKNYQKRKSFFGKLKELFEE